MGLALTLAVSNTIPALAGTWVSGTGADSGKYWYRWSDGSYPRGVWEWIDGNNDGIAECYYFNTDGWLAVNTNIDGSHVNADGAWVADGKIKTKSASEIPAYNRGNASGKTPDTAQNTGSQNSKWVQDGSAWKYRDGNGFATEKWIKDNGNKYYCDDQSEMVVGFAEIDGARYYFKADGTLQTKTFQADGIWYVVDANDSTIVDEVDEDEWAVYRSENGVTKIDWSAVAGTGYVLNKDTDRNVYLSTNGMNDMKVVCAILGVNGVTTDTLNKKEKAVYDVVKGFMSKKKLRSMDDYEKVQEITKFIWKKASYKKVGTDCYTPYGALVNGQSVCEGYARSFKLLCNCLGISCYVMDGWRSAKSGHAWNGVMIDGEWYMADVTEPTGKNGMKEDFAPGILFNEEMVERGFVIHYEGTTVYVNIEYYRECDLSEYPSMDGMTYIDESYIRYLD